jgi:hypothetical protein
VARRAWLDVLMCINALARSAWQKRNQDNATPQSGTGCRISRETPWLCR